MTLGVDVVVIGSLNVDHVYRVTHISRPGETIGSTSYMRTAGGKGLNQSIALARAGVSVAHAGKIGKDGELLLSLLASEGVETSRIAHTDTPTGHAIIQVDERGENSIVLYGGANREIRPEDVDAALAGGGEWVLTQNETTSVRDILERARQRKRKLALNPAPMSSEVAALPLEALDLLVVNEIEGRELAGGEGNAEALVERLRARCPKAIIALTLGGEGAIIADARGPHRIEAHKVEAIDTTGAGDTFVGYLLAGLIQGAAPEEAARRAVRAAAICCTRRGAAASIPRAAEVD